MDIQPRGPFRIPCRHDQNRTSIWHTCQNYKAKEKMFKSCKETLTTHLQKKASEYCQFYQ